MTENNKTPKSVPFIVYESMLEKEDRQQRSMGDHKRTNGDTKALTAEDL